MAYTKEQWEKAKAYYEAGLSLSQIKDKTNIARNTISQRAKREQWEQGLNSEYIEAKVNLVEKKGTVLEQSGTVALAIADDVADDRIRRKGLVFNASELLLKRTHEMLNKNTTVEKVSVGDGVQNFEPRELNASDYKNLAETIDKTAVTLEVAPRHSNSQINVNTQNNNVSQIELNKEIVTQTLENFENEY